MIKLREFSDCRFPPGKIKLSGFVNSFRSDYNYAFLEVHVFSGHNRRYIFRSNASFGSQGVFKGKFTNQLFIVEFETDESVTKVELFLYHSGNVEMEFIQKIKPLVIDRTHAGIRVYERWKNSTVNYLTIAWGLAYAIIILSNFFKNRHVFKPDFTSFVMFFTIGILSLSLSWFALHTKQHNTIIYRFGAFGITSFAIAVFISFYRRLREKSEDKNPVN